MHTIAYFKNRHIFVGCLAVTLMIAALMVKLLIRECAPLLYDEGIAAAKMVPSSLSPILVSAVLAAYFIDRGFTKAVASWGAALVVASTIIEMGSAVWLASVDNPINVSLYGYSCRLPVAALLVAWAFCAGGAVAVLESMLSYTRNSDSFLKEARLFSVIAVGGIATLVFAVFILGRLNITWTHIAVALFLYVMASVGVLCYLLHIEERGAGSCQPSCVRGKEGGRESLLWFCVILLALTTAVSFWVYVRAHWLEGHPGRWPENYIAISASSLAMAISLLLTRNKPRNGYRAVTGSALLVGGAPLIPAFQDMLIIDVAPSLVLGIGLAMVLQESFIPFLMVPARRYATFWVGTAIFLGLVSMVLVAVLDGMASFLKTVSIPLYTVYPLLFLGLLLLAHLSARREAETAATSDINL